MSAPDTLPAAADAAALPSRPGPLLVERDDALVQLQQALEAAGRSGGRIVLVRGEAGLGKSSLIQRFVETLPGPRAAAIGYCDPLHTPRPLGPVRDLAEHLLGPERGAPDESRHFSALLQRLARRRRGQQPVHVLVLEDLHWVDQRSVDWLQYIGRRIAQLCVLLIGSCRDDEVDAAHPLTAALAALPAARLQRIDLRPLSEDGVRRLGEVMVPESRVDAEALCAVTGGNPFYVAELLQQSHESGPEVALPGSVADAVNARLHTLPAPLCALVELASCSPAGTPVDVLRAAPVPDAPAWLDEALHRRLLVASGDNVQFRHELVRVAVQQRLNPGTMRAAHRYLLDALLARPDPRPVLDRLVHHAQGAGADEVLLTHAPAAARRAAAYGAHREAAAYWASAMAVADAAPPEVAAAIHEQWAYEAGLSTGIDEQVIAARQRAVALWRQAGRPDKIGENLAGLSRLHWYRGESSQAQAYIEQAIAALEAEAPSAAKARAWALRAQLAMLQDRMDDAVDWGRQAQHLAEQAGDVEMRAHALNTVGTARLFRADPGGEALLRESLRLALAHGLHEQAARVYTNLSECLIELRALDRADALIAEGIAFDTAHDLDAWTYYLVGRQAQLRFEQDRYAEALAIAEGVLAQDRQTLLMRMPARIVRARAMLRLGTPGAAEALGEALAAAERIGEPQYVAALRIAQVEAALLTGRQDEARAAIAWMSGLDVAALSPRKLGELLFWRHLLDPRSAPMPALPPATLDHLPSPFAHLLAGRHPQAVAGFEAERSAYLEAWARAAWGWSQGELDKGPQLSAAHALLARLHAEAARRRLHAPAPVDTVVASLAPTAEPAPAGPVLVGTTTPPCARGPYAAARTHPYGMTRKEQQVLSLLAAGLSNAAIADTLHRSRRTVENHVSAILSKLGETNRVSVVLRVQSEPWIAAGAAQETLPV